MKTSQRGRGLGAAQILDERMIARVKNVQKLRQSIQQMIRLSIEKQQRLAQFDLEAAVVGAHVVGYVQFLVYLKKKR